MAILTFQELGIPFPLFEAPIECSGSFFECDDCSFCGSESVPCFEIEPEEKIVECFKCEGQSTREWGPTQKAACAQCKSDFVNELEEEDLRICYPCLREGRAALEKTTELGVVSLREALTGEVDLSLAFTSAMACGFDPESLPKLCLPNLLNGPGTYFSQRLDFLKKHSSRRPGRLEMAKEDLYELLRTPSFITWQQDFWFFCCQRPMIFIGEWSIADFAKYDGRLNGWRAFKELLGATESDLPVWKSLAGDSDTIGGPYLFRCQICREHRGYWDAI